MGFGFRKSFSTGPFRFTVSKSGVSTSFGVRGARVTTGPRGTYITVSSHGLYYRERIDQSGQSKRKTTGTMFPDGSADDAVRNAPVSNLMDSSSEKLLADLNSRAQMFNLATIGWIFTAVWPVFVLMNQMPLATVLLSVLTATVSIALQLRHQKEVKTHLFYELDTQAEQRFRAIKDGAKALWSCQTVWRVERRQFTSDWKRNAGAAHLSHRKRIACGFWRTAKCGMQCGNSHDQRRR